MGIVEFIQNTVLRPRLQKLAVWSFMIQLGYTKMLERTCRCKAVGCRCFKE
jgi:hypothetical protein